LPCTAAMSPRATLAALAVTRTESLLLYPLAFGLLVCSRAHGISRTAMVPELLDPEGTRDQRDLVAVNGRMARVAALGGTAGALIGVALDRLVGNGVLWAAAATFAAGTLPPLSLPRRQAPASRPRAPSTPADPGAASHPDPMARRTARLARAPGRGRARAGG